MPPQTVTLRHLTEAEIPRHIYIIRTSFYHANDANNRILYPGGITPALLEYMIARGVRDFRAAKSNKVFLGAFANVTNDRGVEEEAMIATALWVLEPGTDAPAPAAHADEIPPFANPEVYRVFHGMLSEGQPRIMAPLTGEPYWHLSLLASVPEYERRGAGSALLKWGLERADAEGRFVFLDATEIGRPLYERVGFTVMDDYVLDGTRWGSERVGHTFPMVRGVGGKPIGDGAGEANGEANGAANGAAR